MNGVYILPARHYIRTSIPFLITNCRSLHVRSVALTSSFFIFLASGWCADPGELPLRLSLKLEPLVTDPAGLLVPGLGGAPAEDDPLAPGGGALPLEVLPPPLVPLPAGVRGEKEER